MLTADQLSPLIPKYSKKLGKAEIKDVKKLTVLEIVGVISKSRKSRAIKRLSDGSLGTVLDFETRWHDPVTKKDTPAIARIHTSQYLIGEEMEGFNMVCAACILVTFRELMI
jgi:hypothetical protein